ncbi:NAD-dependent epimerase/dehydratase family protein [Limnospira fusiformis]|uniref:NAD-dependent epimerase/dehydratase family protein n=1 Tax=Limnospira fusiformis TaxID=54297 RepID=UPI0014497C9C|nr:NAD(P)-dependent oxidoreductase [Limnospira fusiformis SAG 85.79]
MNKAIITGSTGLVGRAVVKHLSDHEIDVICLGRRSLSPVDILNIFGRKVHYLNISMKEILTLPAMIKSIGWTAEGGCVFYNFAWGGSERLTDGSFGEQLSNAIYAANAVKAAKQLGCSKFVNAGTIEETYVEKYIEKNDNEPYQSTQIDYSLAKIASRDMCKIVAYLEKIDYIHTRLSVPLDPEFSMGSYIASTLRKIMKGEPYDAPVNKKLFDIISTNEVARAYRLIGEVGKNKSDYFIGTAHPITLGQFFKDFAELISGAKKNVPETVTAVDSHLFSIEKLASDTGFVPVGFFQDFQKVHNI